MSENEIILNDIPINTVSQQQEFMQQVLNSKYIIEHYLLTGGNATFALMKTHSKWYTFSCGVNAFIRLGNIYEEGKRPEVTIVVSNVNSNVPQTGMFKEFIIALEEVAQKLCIRKIGFEQVHSERLRDILTRHGYTLVSDPYEVHMFKTLGGTE